MAAEWKHPPQTLGLQGSLEHLTCADGQIAAVASDEPKSRLNLGHVIDCTQIFPGCLACHELDK